MGEGSERLGGVNVARCVACGQFMNCEEIDAHCDFTPDTPFGPERVEWTCGPCVRRKRAEDDE